VTAALPPRTFEGPTDLAPLFAPLSLNAAVTIKNRIALAPCTRNRALADLSTTSGAIDHYASRAEAGLLITEGTLISRRTRGYLDTPGIFQGSHVEAWARVTEAVHARGGVIFCQLWHLGRMAHSYFGGEAVGPSPVLDRAERRAMGRTGLFHEPPREMTLRDIDETVGDYARAARLARQAGFDGIEIHGANGYLPDQFLRQHTNRRDDAWGGSAEKRAGFAVAVAGAAAAEIGAERVGFRMSPAAYYSEMRYTPGDNEAITAALDGLARLGLAYLHCGIIEDESLEYLGCTSSAFLRKRWGGVLIGNGGYTPQAAARHIAAGGFEVIAWGKPFLANPDLVERVRQGAPLKPYSREIMDGFR
jgi:N-ethylmaleimide reductase